MDSYIYNPGGSINTSTITIEIDSRVAAICAAFADERIKSSEALYKSRGEARTSKIKQDITTGAMAEFAVQQMFLNSGKLCSAPDLTIHKQRNKSFGADLNTDNGVVHVKSQTVESAEKYGASWMFQKEDKLLTLPSESGRIVFCLVDGNSVHIKAVVSMLDIVEANLVKAPKVFKYALSKNALYLEDILNSNIELWRV